MKLQNKLWGIFFLSFTVLYSSCFLDSDNIIPKDVADLSGLKWDPEFAIPLVKSKMSLRDIVKTVDSEFIETDGNNLIHVYYRKFQKGLIADQFLFVGTQDFKNVVIPTAAEVLAFQNDDSVTMVRELMHVFDVPFGDVDSMLMRSMELMTSISSSSSHKVQLTLTYPNARKNGKAFEVSFDSLGFSASKTSDLTGYTLDMTKGPSKENELIVQLKATVFKRDISAFSTTDFIEINDNFQRNLYGRYYGFTGQDNLFDNRVDTMDLDIFSGSSDGGSFVVDDPRIKFIYHNSFGVPIAARLYQMKAVLSNGTIQDLTGIPDPLPIPSPNASQFGQIVSDSFQLNKGNSNLGSIISGQPSKFIVEFNGSMNPSGKSNENFMMNNSALDLTVEVDVPLAGSANNYSFQQDQEFSLDLGDEVDLEYVVMRIFLENDFPVDLGLQVYFMNSTNQILDSLNDSGKLFLASSIVDGSGRTTTSTKAKHDWKFTKDRLDNIRSADRIRIVYTINTYKDGGGGQPIVKFYDDYELDVRLGVAAKISINSGL
jgi:hypothetical protein